MARNKVASRAGLMFVTAITASFSMTSFAAADTITNTGPHSRNKITSNTKNKCDIYTENDIDIHNKNKQEAESGDAAIIDNTTVRDSEPELDIAALDDTDQMTSETPDNQEPLALREVSEPETDDGRASSEHGKQEDGSVKTGDAINSNESHFNVSIETDNECPPKKKAPHAHKPGHHVKPSHKPKVSPSKVPAHKPVGGAGQGAGFGAGVAPRVSHAPQPKAPPSKPVQHHVPKPAAPCPPEQGHKISNTGPGSYNKINEQVSNNYSTTTTNSVSISNSNYQTAQSGNAYVSNNTHAGAGTGDAVNGNGTGAGISTKTSN